MTTTENNAGIFRITISNSGDWSIVTAETITDAHAKAITWRANPSDVVLGAYVQVSDAGGLRIGHLAKATYHNPWAQTPYVICELELM
jgi:hypothetical protein